MYRLVYVPFVLFSVLGLEVTKRMLLLLVFASDLLLSFSSMVGLFGEFRPNKNFKKERPRTYFTTLIVVGLAIGVLTAFTGAGGGVLLVPLLVLVVGLPMKTVVCGNFTGDHGRKIHAWFPWRRLCHSRAN